MARRAMALILMAPVLALLVAGSVRAETFDLAIHTYCAADSSVCGFGSYHAYRQYILQVINEINVQWEPNGISFRPALIYVPIPEADFEAARCINEDPNDGVDETALFQDWRQTIAANEPTRISILLNDVAQNAPSRMCCSELPTNPGIPAESLFGILCDNGRNAYDLGSVLAHELGHHFCLCHTHGWNVSTDSPMDTADWTSADGDLDWSGDSNDQCEVYDTSADPGWEEPYDGNGDGVGDPGRDRQANGLWEINHEYCAPTVQTMLDSGSPHGQYCDLHCNRTATGWPVPFDPGTDPADEPVQAMSMSYWGSGCVGPYVRAGHRQEAFSTDSIQKVAKCYQTYRQGVLQDACAGKGGDSDHDGWCNQEDNCALVRNTLQEDIDHDGFGDPCDLSPYQTGEVDADDDFISSLFDMDDDGDGCPDVTDQHPDDGSVVVGSSYSYLCGWGVDPVYAFEGLDADGDTWLNCEDYDDDNDGVCDEGGPLGPAAPGVPPGGCAAGPDGVDPCPLEAGDGCHPFGATCPPPWKTCQGSSCDPFFLQMTAIVSPTEFVVLPGRFRILNETIYVTPLPGRTLSETARVLNGDFSAAPKTGGITPGAGAAAAEPSADAAAGAAIAPGDPVQLEIRAREDGRLVAVVARFDAGDAVIGDMSRGSFLAVSPGSGGGSLTVQGTFSIGHDPAGPPMFDGDDDAIPAARDNCTAAYNPRQIDSDEDGFGNACDADLDNDLVVSEADLALVQACDGADVTLKAPLQEPPSLHGISVPPSPCGGFGDCPAYELAKGCAGADLDENGVVDRADADIALMAAGLPPGPSAAGNPADLCAGVSCDDGIPCTEDRCVPALGTCAHVPVVCNDFDACTRDRCEPSTGACVSAPIVCDDRNGCTADSCDPGSGCRFEPLPAGTGCDDGNACTFDDICDLGACMPGWTIVCNDGDPCTADACDPATGACFVAGPACDDQNPCTIDSCSGRSGTCSHTLAQDDTPCDDGDACTTADGCLSGECVGGATTSCEDGDLCTVDLCDRGTGVCRHAAVTCDDGDACTSDSCDPASGRCLQSSPAFADVQGVQFTNRISLSWTPTASGEHWNTYRGTIPPLLLGSRGPGAEYDHACYESADFGGDGPTRSLEFGNPPLGWSYYYLVSEEQACGEGGLGWTSFLVPRPIPAACPTPP